MSDFLALVLGFAALAFYGLWRNAVWRERWATQRADRLEREVAQKTELLFALAGIDPSAAEPKP